MTCKKDNIRYDHFCIPYPKNLPAGMANSHPYPTTLIEYDYKSYHLPTNSDRMGRKRENRGPSQLPLCIHAQYQLRLPRPYLVHHGTTMPPNPKNQRCRV